MALVRYSILFVALLVIADRAIGTAFEHLYFLTRSGEGGGQINAALAAPARILLAGSSRMKHHADTAVLADRLDTSVYNAGINGHDFLYAAMLLDLRLHAPDPPPVVVLHIDPDSFSYNRIELSRARIFSYYLDRSPIVRRVLFEEGWIQRGKYLSRTYRANGKVLPIMKNALLQANTLNGGFEPLNGSMHLPVTPPPAIDTTFWRFKLELFEELVRVCHAAETTLVLVNSPIYFVTGAERAQYDQWRSVLVRMLDTYPDVPFLEINSVSCPAVFEDPAIYRDSSHLNSGGAHIYSQLLATGIESAIRVAPQRIHLTTTGATPTTCSPGTLLHAAVHGKPEPDQPRIDLRH